MKVGVVDVGSNTIKLLIAKKGERLPAEQVAFIVEETRIGEGIAGKPPCISSESIRKGASAIARLVSEARARGCQATKVVATSAVREAQNRDEFCAAAETLSGLEPEVLTGEQEARLIGESIRCDPDLGEFDSFLLLDLGGGSLECIQFANGAIKVATSLALGSVRLASLLVQDRNIPLPAAEQESICKHAKRVLRESGLPEGMTRGMPAVLTGGSAKSISAAFATKNGTVELEKSRLQTVAANVCSLDLEARAARYRVARQRADILPTALLTLLASIDYLGSEKLHFTEFNLRFGIAARMLQALGNESES